MMDAQPYGAMMPMQARMTSPESEAAIIGGLLNRNDFIDELPDLLPEHFADESMRMVFAEACSQISAGKACDVVTVYEALAGALDLAFIGSMAQFTPSASNMRAYSEIVIDRAKSRLLSAASMAINDLAHDTARSIDERLEAAQAELAKLASSAETDDWVGAHAGMLGHIDLLNARAEGRIVRVATGLCDLDRMLNGGFNAGDFVVVGARPSHGKTAFAMSVGLHMARTRHVAMLSMEMSHAQLNDRNLAILGRVALDKLARPDPNDSDFWQRVLDATEQGKHLQWSACDSGSLNINQVRARARALHRKHGMEVLIVDYIGLMDGVDKKASRVQQLEEVSRGLKSLAKELGIVVICLAQLNRQADDLAYDAVPTSNHLRDCGAIEQDADVVLLLKRPIVSKQDLGEEWKQYAKLSVAKARQGATGLVHLHYHGEQTRFDSWAGDVPKKSAASTGGSKGFDYKGKSWMEGEF